MEDAPSFWGGIETGVSTSAWGSGPRWCREWKLRVHEYDVRTY